MKYDKEDGTLNFNEKCFIHPIFEWEQIWGNWNWRTFHLVEIEFEIEHMSGGWEITVIILGIGFRFRYNFAFEESEVGQRFAEFKKSSLSGQSPEEEIKK